jgi:hypothetical protein
MKWPKRQIGIDLHPDRQSGINHLTVESDTQMSINSHAHCCNISTYRFGGSTKLLRSRNERSRSGEREEVSHLAIPGPRSDSYCDAASSFNTNKDCMHTWPIRHHHRDPFTALRLGGEQSTGDCIGVEVILVP